MTFYFTECPAVPRIAIARARGQLLGSLAGLVGLAVLLPSPLAIARLLAGQPAAIAGDGATVAALVVAAVAVWALLVATVGVCAVALLSRLPGRAGRWGAVALRHLVPHRWRAWTGAVVGITLLAGTAACGSAGNGSRSSTGTSAIASTADAASTSTTVEIGSGALLTLDGLDWPTDAPSSDTSPAGTSPPGTSPEGTGGPPGPADVKTPQPTTVQTAQAPTVQTAQPPAGPGTTSETAPLPSAAPSSPATSRAHTAGSTSAEPTPAVSAPAEPTPGAPGAAPTSPSVSPPVSPSATPAASQPTVSPVVVQPGDSLWKIAARYLPAGTEDAVIDATWRQWYAANRAVIGADPDLILPGQQLHAPDPKVTR